KVDGNWNDNIGILKGSLTMNDMKNYTTVIRKPVHVSYRGYEIYGPPPVSSGGITIGQILNILEGYNLREMPQWKRLHYFIEACRYAYADRNRYIGDPQYTEVPISDLLNKNYAKLRRKLIN